MKTTLLIAMALVPAVARAQDLAERPPAFSAAGSFFALSVDDIDASVRWYRQKLGMKIVLNARLNDVTIVVLEGGGLIVELIDRADAVSLRSLAPETADNINRVHGYVKAGLIVDDWDALLRMLREREVEIVMGPFPKRPDKRANLAIKDNSGNLIQFFGR